MVKKTRQIIVLHPFLFAVYSILGVYSQNASQVPIGWVSRPLILLVLITLAVYIFLQKVFKDHEYSGFVSTLFINWIFMGHIYRFLSERSSFWRTPAGGFCAFLLVSLPLGFLASKWVWNRLTNRKVITTFLNVTSLALLAYPGWITMGIFFEGSLQIQSIRKQQAQFEVPFVNAPESSPDIYLIIVDGYGRADMLQNLYGYNNSHFVDFLKKQGFYVADGATSNYPQTNLSLSSMLNLNYLDEYTQGFTDSGDHKALSELIHHSILRRSLEEQGYKFVALPSASLTTQIRDADVYFDSGGADINEFEALLLSTTVLGMAGESWGLDLPVMGYKLHRSYVVSSLDNLQKVPQIPGPKFVFAHIMLPHPPFIFDRDGNFLPPDRPYILWDGSLFPGTAEEYQEGYSAQMTFLNRKLVQIISSILAQSANPPIIILQGDHGPGAFYNMDDIDSNSCLRERFSILNAYYFPDGDYRLLYPTITPVNTFRVVLDQYLGAQLDLLDDKSYYASWDLPYSFTEVTSRVSLPCEIPGKGAH